MKDPFVSLLSLLVEESRRLHGAHSLLVHLENIHYVASPPPPSSTKTDGVVFVSAEGRTLTAETSAIRSLTAVVRPLDSSKDVETIPLNDQVVRRWMKDDAVVVALEEGTLDERSFFDFFSLLLSMVMEKEEMVEGARELRLPLSRRVVSRGVARRRASGEAQLEFLSSSGLVVGEACVRPSKKGSDVARRLVSAVLKELRIDLPLEGRSLAEAGVDSLLQAQLEAELRRRGLAVPFGGLSRLASLEELLHSELCKNFHKQEALTEKNQEYEVGEEEEGEGKGRGKARRLPLSRVQTRLVFLSTFETKHSERFHERLLFRSPHLDEGRFLSAWRRLEARHAGLRSLIHVDGQEIFSLTENLRLPEKGMDIHEFLARAFHFDDGPPLRLLFMKEEDGCTLVAVVLHHLIVDGHALKVLLKELADIYHKPSPRLPALKGQFPDFILSQAKQNAAEKTGEAFWMKKLEGLDSQLLRTDKPRGSTETFKGDVFVLRLDEKTRRALDKLQRETGVSSFVVLLSLLRVLVYKMSGQRDYCIGTTMANRRAPFLDLVACCINVVALREELHPTLSLVQWIQQIHKTVVEAKAHEDVAFDRVLQLLKVEREPSSSPLFQLMFVMDETLSPSQLFPQTEEVFLPETSTQYEQTWFIVDDGENLSLKVNFNSLLYNKETIEDLCRRLLLLLVRASRNSQAKIFSLSIATHDEVLGMKTQRKDCPMHSHLSVFLKKVEKKSTIIDRGEKISFEELEETSHVLSQLFFQRHFQQNGELPLADSPAAVQLPRNRHLLATVLALWKASFFVVPIGNQTTPERLEQVFVSLRRPLFISASLLDELPSLPKRVSSRGLNRSHPFDLLYSTFTSGSTGVPKGILTPSVGLPNLVQAYTRAYLYSSHTILYQTVNIGFDVFFADIASAFLNGASLFLAANQLPSVTELPSVTDAYLMPAFISCLPPRGVALLRSFNSLFFGGERIDAKVFSSLIAEGVRAFQGWGLTEQTVYSSTHRLHRGDKISDVGQPFHNLKAELRDADGQLLPWEHEGEIFVRGFLCRGYIGMSPREKDGLLPSGDVLGITRNGSLHFVGRKDDQVKVAGRRIELLEIQKEIQKDEDIERCVIVMREERGRKELVAYLILRVPSTEEQLRDRLLSRLPLFFVPAHLVILDSFPLNANGKVDKKRLPSPRRRDERVTEGEEPLSSLEKELCKMFAEELKVSRVGVEECFFRAGGDSFSALLILQRLKEQLGHELNLGDFFRLRTPKAIAARLQSVPREEQFAEKKKACARREDMNVPLSSAQKRFLVLEELQKEVYHTQLLLSFQGNLSTKTLLFSLNRILLHNQVLRLSVIVDDEGVHQELLSGTETFMALLPPRSLEISLRVSLQQVDSSKTELLLCLPHSKIDGRSLGMIAEQLALAYNHSLPRSTQPDFIEYCRWEASCDFSQDIQYWKEKLHGIARPFVPIDGEEHGDAVYEHSFDVSLREGLHKLSVLHNCSLFSVLSLAFSLLISKLCTTKEAVFGVIVAGRHASFKDVVGPFANTLLLRIPLLLHLPIQELLHKIVEELSAAVAHDVPFDLLVDQLGLQRSIDPPLFDFLLNFQNTSLNEMPKMKDLIAKANTLPPRGSPSLQNWIFSEDSSLRLLISYRHFKRCSVQRFVSTFEDLLQRILRSNTSEPVSSLLEKEEEKEEEAMLEVWRNLLRRPTLGLDDNFFANGGNSLLGLSLISRIRREWTKEVTLNLLFEAQTPRLFHQKIALLTGRDGAGIPIDIQSSQKEERVKKVEAAPAQRFLLRGLRLQDEAFAESYRTWIQFREPNLNKQRLSFAINRLLLINPALRSRFKEEDTKFLQEFWSATEVFLSLTPRTENRPLEILNAPGVAVVVEEEEVEVSLSHAVVDGQSLQLISQQLKALYRGERVKGCSFKHYVDHLRSLQEEYEKNKEDCTEFWSQSLKDLAVNRILHRVQVKTSQKTLRVWRKEKQLWKEVRDRAIREGTSPFLLLLHTLSEAIRPLSADPSRPLTIGFPMDQRRGREVFVGMAVHTSLLLMRSKDTIQDATRQMSLVVEHSSLPYEEIVAMNGDRELFDVMLVLEDSQGEETALETTPPPSKFPLTAFAFANEDDLQLEVHFREELFEESDLKAVLDAWVSYLQGESLKDVSGTDSRVVNGFLVDLKRLRPLIHKVLGRVPWTLSISSSPHKLRLIVDEERDERIRRQLALKLPVHMMPSKILFLHQKNDRAEGLMKEERTQKILGEVLHLEEVFFDDDFFALGGNSLTALRFVSALSQAGFHCSVQDIYQHRPLSQLIQFLEKNNVQVRKESARLDPLEGFPLSEEQKRMAFLCTVDPHQHYQLPFVQKFPKSVSMKDLHRTFHELVQLQESLRTIFLERKSLLKQCVLSGTEVFFALRSSRVKDEDLVEALRALSREPLDLESPVKVFVLETEKELVVLLLLHHILSDASSTQIMERQFSALFSGHHLPPHTYTYMHYAEEEKTPRNPSEESLQKLEDSLRSHSPSIHRVLSPQSSQFILDRSSTDNLRETASKRRSSPFLLLLASTALPLHALTHRSFITMSAPDANRNSETAELVGLFLNNLFFTSSFHFGQTIDTYLDGLQEEVERTKKENADMSRVIAALRDRGVAVEGRITDFFLNCRYDLESGEELAMSGMDKEVLPRLRENNEFPLEVDVDFLGDVVRVEVRLETSFLHISADTVARLIQETLQQLCFIEEIEEGLKTDEREDTNFAVDKDFVESVEWKELERRFPEGTRIVKKKHENTWKWIVNTVCTQLTRRRKTLEDDLLLLVNGQRISWPSNQEALRESLKVDTLEVRVSDLLQVNAGLQGKDVVIKISYRNLFYEETINDILLDIGRSISARPSKRRRRRPLVELPRGSLSHILWNQCVRTPARPSLSNFSYSNLQRRLLSDAQCLRVEYWKTTGELILPDTPIAVIGHSSADTTLLCLAILVTGAVYLPLDEDSPEDRLRIQLEECRVQVCLSSRSFNLPTVGMISLASSNLKAPPSFFFLNESSDVAYVISTSGTTGRPKGVAAVHSSLLHTLLASTRQMAHQPTDRVFQFTNFVFDNSVLEVWTALSNGASLSHPRLPFDVDAFVHSVKEEGVTHALLFPGLVHIFDESQFSLLALLRYWVMGAEKASKKLVDAAIEKGIRVLQNYGPTETTAYALSRRMKRGDHPNNIGSPFGGNGCSVKDEQEKERPCGVPGELFLYGPGLMRGYVGKGPLGPFYATGDIVKERRDGNFVILGRRDGQVKIRGHRVELAEVEALVNHSRHVEKCKAVWRDECLLLYFTGKEEEIRLEELCRHRLPQFMQPNHFVRLLNFPLTNNTKIDVAALPPPRKTTIATQLKEKKNGLEEIWRSLLPHSANFSPSSHFFLSGGDSFLLLRLRSKIREELEVEISVDTLLSNLRLGEMEQLVEKGRGQREKVLVELFLKTDASLALVLFPALVGGVLAYGHLHRALHSSAYSIYGAQPLSGEKSIQNMAHLYTEELLELKEKELVLVGASFGGLLAYDVALELRRHRRVPLVILIDTHAEPSKAPRISLGQHREQMLAVLAGYEVEEEVKEEMVQDSWKLLQTAYEYEPSPSDLPLLVLSVEGTSLGWQQVTTPCLVESLAGTHSDMLDAVHVPALADAILRHIQLSSHQ